MPRRLDRHGARMVPVTILRALAASVLLLPCAVEAAAASAPEGELWMASGQSNAVGCAPLPGPEPDPRVQTIDPDSGAWVVARDPLPICRVIGVAGTATGKVSPWVGAAIEVAKTTGPIRLVGYASGGQPISFWDEGKTGAVYLAANLEKARGKPSVMLWYQGEQDGASGMDVDAYAARLTDWLARARGLARNKELVVVVVQLGNWKDTRGDFMPIREAQRRVVAQDPHALLVPAFGLPLVDGVHIDTAAARVVSHDIAQAVLRSRGVKSAAAWPGPVMDAAVPGQDPRTCMIHFAEVAELKGANREDFCAIDAGGTVACTAIDVGKTRAALHFERALQAPARVVYGVGQSPAATLIDEAGFRAPAAQLTLTKGPVPEDKETRAPNGAGTIAPAAAPRR
jgi:hypothetical protein